MLQAAVILVAAIHAIPWEGRPAAEEREMEPSSLRNLSSFS